MLTHLTSFHQYIDFVFLHSSLSREIIEYRLLDDDFSKALFKMVQLDVDSIIPLFYTRYSSTGRPAINQMEIFRSFILMSHFGFSSISKWCRKLRQDPALALLIGCEPFTTPSSSCHYDFISRFFPQITQLRILPAFKNTKSKLKPKRNEKLENVPQGKVRQLVESFNDSYPQMNDYFIQTIFNTVAVQPSFDKGLIEPKNVILSGDGTALPIHSSPYGSKLCECKQHCSCDRRYSDIDADFGWDSDIGRFYFGYTGYSLTTRNHNFKIDLPLFLTLAKASQHDSITSVTAFNEFYKLNNGLIPISYYCLDSASDNYATHEYVNSLGIAPLIDINKRASHSVYDQHIGISENGRPLCIAGEEMKPFGYDRKRYRHKFRCPYFNKDNTCPLREQCTPSPYGRVIYIKSRDDIKLFGPVPFHSKKWFKIYKDRTSCERINNRIINDYRLSNMTMKGRNRNLFLMLIIGINIHLDAFYKITRL